MSVMMPVKTQIFQPPAVALDTVTPAPPGRSDVSAAASRSTIGRGFFTGVEILQTALSSAPVPFQPGFSRFASQVNVIDIHWSRMDKVRPKDCAFTLIELLVVIAIIAILRRCCFRFFPEPKPGHGYPVSWKLETVAARVAKCM